MRKLLAIPRTDFLQTFMGCRSEVSKSYLKPMGETLDQTIARYKYFENCVLMNTKKTDD
jgi:hypothetical protein